MIGVLSTLGIIVLLLILLAAAYFWWRHKRSQLEFVEPTDENETSSGSLKFQQLLESQQQEQLLLEQQKQQQQQQQAGAQPNNINRKLNGFLNLKTPLIGWVQSCLCLPVHIFLIHFVFQFLCSTKDSTFLNHQTIFGFCFWKFKILLLLLSYVRLKFSCRGIPWLVRVCQQTELVC